MVHVFILSISEGWGDDPRGYVLPNRDMGDPGGILGYSVFVRRPWFLERCSPWRWIFSCISFCEDFLKPRHLGKISLFPENLKSHIIFIIVIIIKFHGSTRTIAFLHIRPQQPLEGIYIVIHFPGGSEDKESTCKVGDSGSILGLGRSPEEGNGNPLQYSCLEDPLRQRSLVGYSPYSLTELDTIEWLRQTHCNSLLFFLVALQVLWNLGSLTRDQTLAPNESPES